MEKQEWTLQNIPPKGHEDVALFVYQLFDLALQEKERLGKPNDFMANYALYRGNTSSPTISGRKGYSPKSKQYTPVNLYFANIERTVSNITARVPTGEVVDLDGLHDEVERILSIQLKKWWQDTDQQPKTKLTARAMEIYGITIEKPIRDPNTNDPDILITDSFAFFPAPGNWANMSTDAPYIAFLYADFVDKIEADFGVEHIAAEDTYDLLGQSREDIKSQKTSQKHTIGNYASAMTITAKQGQNISDRKIQRGIIIELWIRDKSKTETITETPVLDEVGQPVLGEDGQPLIQVTKTQKLVHPDGIRKITISRSKDPKLQSNWVVLDDTPNPNINYRHLEYGIDVSSTYPWGRLPVYIANSYRDGISIWGFAASEQVGDLLEKINLIVTKLIAYVINVMTPPLIVQQHCGITREMIESSIQKAGRLILMPSTPNARIEFMTIPNLPDTFFKVLNLIVGFFDRVYQIEDADRGVVPSGVVAASAIIALQERNMVLMQSKTASIDFIAEQRSKWAIGLWQNWGTELDSVDVNGEQYMFRAVDYIGRKFNFIVESGSTTPKTSLQLQELAKWLYEVKAIGQKGLLEAVNWPNWREEVERTAESQLDQALQVLIDAGLPEEQAVQLKQILEQLSLQNDAPKTAAQGRQPVQPKSLVPKSSNVQSGS